MGPANKKRFDICLLLFFGFFLFCFVFSGGGGVNFLQFTEGGGGGVIKSHRESYCLFI